MDSNDSDHAITRASHDNIFCQRHDRVDRLGMAEQAVRHVAKVTPRVDADEARLATTQELASVLRRVGLGCELMERLLATQCETAP